MSAQGASPRPPRVAVVVPKYGLVGGGERFAAELTERLARTGRYEFHVFANRWSAAVPGIAFHKVPAVRFPRSLRPLAFAWLADRMVARGGFDIVHAHERVLRADVFSMHAVPHAGWVRDVRKKRASLFDRATIFLERRMMANARRSVFLPVSTLAAGALQREYAVAPGRVRVVPPGVDVARFSGPDRDACRSDIRARHGIGASDLLVLFVGMNFEVKGLDAVVAAVASARRERPDAGIRLLVVGKGDAARYGDLARSLGIGDAVAFAGPQADGMERYYRAADLFIMLSRFDTFGMAVLEAMAAGLPAIVSPCVGAKDVVGEGGFVVPAAGDAGAAARAIVAMAEGDARARVGAEAQRTASRHTWDRTAEAVERVYDEILGRTAPRTDGRTATASERGGTDLSVIIVSYNTADLIRPCLDAVDAERDVPLEVFVVDNASTDGSADVVRRSHPSARLVANPVNRGFGAANNQALPMCRGRYVVLLNPDTVLRPGAFREMVAYMDAHPRVGLAGASLVNPDGTPQDSVAHRYPGQKHARGELSGLGGTIACVMGACQIVRTELMRRIGGFDEDFFLYGEDQDLCLRIRREGFDIGFVASAVVVHHGGQSERDTVPLALWRKKLAAEYLFYSKHYRAETIRRIAGAARRRAAWQIALKRVALPFAGNRARAEAKLEKYRAVREAAGSCIARDA